ncbi:MAG TPA: ABC transporter substrate-binding protein [Candidatus Limnocylindrales bacterium]|jgi:peptide/nickel transport system substrate-binding protein
MHQGGAPSEPDGQTRRDFIRRVSVVGAAAVAVPTGLAACGGSTSSSSTSTSQGTPKKGGVLRAAFSGGSSTDTIDGDNVINNLDFARTYQLYDSLVKYDEHGQIVNSLAEEITPNADATMWTIHLRSGVEWHNGKPLDADDVAFTFKRIVNPKAPLVGAPTLALLDVKNIKKVDKLTLQVPMHAPFSTFIETLPNYTYFIVPVGFDLKHPIGTGPFKFKSFKPGQQSTFVRNDNYWNGAPYVDEIVISDYADEQSQIDALTSGQADLADFLSASSIATVQNAGAKISIQTGGSMVPITMRTDAAPFNDVRVRQAMRLIIDRQQMLNVVFLGHGIIGNDVVSYFDPSYDHSLPQRHQDIDQAKSLLKAAGHENLTTTFVTAPMGQGAVQSAQVLAQQAKAAGVTINLRQLTVTDFFGPNYLKWVYSQDTWQAFPYFPMVAFGLLGNAPANETHFHDPQYESLYTQGLKTVDKDKRTQIAHDMQMIEYDRGGYIIPFFSPTIDAVAKNVMGTKEGKTGVPFNQHDYTKVWLA